MSIETRNPRSKEDLQENFRRSDRKQDHGTGHARRGVDLKGKSIRLYNENELEYRDRKMSRSLNDLTPAQGRDLALVESHLDSIKNPDDYEEMRAPTSRELGSAADALLRMDASNIHTSESTDKVRVRIVTRKSPFSSVASGYGDDLDLSKAMTIHSNTRGQRGTSSSPDVTYEGNYGDDDDLKDAKPLDGFLIR